MGAELQPGGGVHFRLWAPCRKRVEVIFEGPRRKIESCTELSEEQGGYFSVYSAEARKGTLYSFRLDSGERLYPDPVSRFQPRGPHGPSQIVDPLSFEWADAQWRGAGMENHIIYEMHIGTFTREGTWAAAAAQLQEIASLGITLVEVMPVADFPGLFGWGYDGVDLFAPSRLYGTPEDFRKFVDTAHGWGIGVILDVVYNHLGPDGNYLKEYSLDYFTDRYFCEWGDAINFDGENSGPVREFFLTNAAYWIDEFHLDGLRIDATQQIFDSSDRNILRELTEAARAAAGQRQVVIIAENEPQDTKLLGDPAEGGYGMDAAWNDDFHHAAMVALNGRREAYYYDYLGSPQEFVSAMKRGFLYQGQYYHWQKNGRGTPTHGIRPQRFVNCIQNHDQVANTGNGLRVHFMTSPALFRIFSALLILGTGTPMIFQGQEFASSSPFHYFADHNPELAKLVKKGRMEFLSQFRSISGIIQSMVADPHSPETFRISKLDFSDREKNRSIYDMYRDLIRLRAADPIFPGMAQCDIDGAVLKKNCFVLRYFTSACDYGRSPELDRLLVVNMGEDIELNPAPEPLLAPPGGRDWGMAWSSDDPKYGGTGTVDLNTGGEWVIPGRSATYLKGVRK